MSKQPEVRQFADGPYLVKDPAGDSFDWTMTVYTSQVNRKCVNTGNRVRPLEEMLAQGYIFTPLVAMTPERIDALESLWTASEMDLSSYGKSNTAKKIAAALKLWRDLLNELKGEAEDS